MESKRTFMPQIATCTPRVDPMSKKISNHFSSFVHLPTSTSFQRIIQRLFLLHFNWFNTLQLKPETDLPITLRAPNTAWPLNRYGVMQHVVRGEPVADALATIDPFRWSISELIAHCVSEDSELDDPPLLVLHGPARDGLLRVEVETLVWSSEDKTFVRKKDTVPFRRMLFQPQEHTQWFSRESPPIQLTREEWTEMVATGIGIIMAKMKADLPSWPFLKHALRLLHCFSEPRVSALAHNLRSKIRIRGSDRRTLDGIWHVCTSHVEETWTAVCLNPDEDESKDDIHGTFYHECGALVLYRGTDVPSIVHSTSFTKQMSQHIPAIFDAQCDGLFARLALEMFFKIPDDGRDGDVIPALVDALQNTILPPLYILLPERFSPSALKCAYGETRYEIVNGTRRIRCFSRALQLNLTEPHQSLQTVTALLLNDSIVPSYPSDIQQAIHELQSDLVFDLSSILSDSDLSVHILQNLELDDLSHMSLEEEFRHALKSAFSTLPDHAVDYVVNTQVVGFNARLLSGMVQYITSQLGSASVPREQVELLLTSVQPVSLSFGQVVHQVEVISEAFRIPKPRSEDLKVSNESQESGLRLFKELKGQKLKAHRMATVDQVVSHKRSKPEPVFFGEAVTHSDIVDSLQSMVRSVVSHPEQKILISRALHQSCLVIATLFIVDVIHGDPKLLRYRKEVITALHANETVIQFITQAWNLLIHCAAESKLVRLGDLPDTGAVSFDLFVKKKICKDDSSCGVHMEKWFQSIRTVFERKLESKLDLEEEQEEDERREYKGEERKEIKESPHVGRSFQGADLNVLISALPADMLTGADVHLLSLLNKSTRLRVAQKLRQSPLARISRLFSEASIDLSSKERFLSRMLILATDNNGWDGLVAKAFVLFCLQREELFRTFFLLRHDHGHYTVQHPAGDSNLLIALKEIEDAGLMEKQTEAKCNIRLFGNLLFNVVRNDRKYYEWDIIHPNQIKMEIILWMFNKMCVHEYTWQEDDVELVLHFRLPIDNSSQETSQTGDVKQFYDLLNLDLGLENTGVVRTVWFHMMAHHMLAQVFPRTIVTPTKFNFEIHSFSTQVDPLRGGSEDRWATLDVVYRLNQMTYVPFGDMYGWSIPTLQRDFIQEIKSRVLRRPPNCSLKSESEQVWKSIKTSNEVSIRQPRKRQFMDADTYEKWRNERYRTHDKKEKYNLIDLEVVDHPADLRMYELLLHMVSSPCAHIYTSMMNGCHKVTEKLKELQFLIMKTTRKPTGWPVAIPSWHLIPLQNTLTDFKIVGTPASNTRPVARSVDLDVWIGVDVIEKFQSPRHIYQHTLLSLRGAQIMGVDILFILLLDTDDHTRLNQKRNGISEYISSRIEMLSTVSWIDFFVNPTNRLKTWDIPHRDSEALSSHVDASRLFDHFKEYNAVADSMAGVVRLESMAKNGPHSYSFRIKIK